MSMLKKLCISVFESTVRDLPHVLRYYFLNPRFSNLFSNTFSLFKAILPHVSFANALFRILKKLQYPFAYISRRIL